MSTPLRRWFDRLIGRDVRQQQHDSATMRLQARNNMLEALEHLTETLKGKR